VKPVGEGSPFGALGVQCCLGALGPGNGGGCELPGGFLPGLAGSLDRGGRPFGLPRGGGLSGLAFRCFGAGLGCGELGGDAGQLAFQFSGPFFCGAGVFFGLAAGGVGRVGGFPGDGGRLRWLSSLRAGGEGLRGRGGGVHLI